MTRGLLGSLRAFLFGEPPPAPPCANCAALEARLDDLRRLAVDDANRALERERKLEERLTRYVEIIQGNAKQFAELASVRLTLAATDPKRPPQPPPGRHDVPPVPWSNSLLAGHHIEMPAARLEEDRTGVPPELQELAEARLTPDQRRVLEIAEEQNRPPRPGFKIGGDVVGAPE